MFVCVCVCVCVCECDCISVYVQGESGGVGWEVGVERGHKRFRVYVCITEELTLPLLFFRPEHESPKRNSRCNQSTDTYKFRLNYVLGMNDTCSGMHMFIDKICRKWLLMTARACNGSVHLHYKSHYLTRLANSIFGDVLNLGNRSKTMVVLNLGLHESLNHRAVIRKVMSPLLSRMAARNLTWPKLLWVGVHQWGLLKSGLGYPTQSKVRVVDFNKQMGSFLDRVGVPVLDTFNLTGGVMSFDGAHFGLGVNKVKADIVLNYLLELQSKGQW